MTSENVPPDKAVDHLIEVVARRVYRQAQWYRSSTTWPRVLFRASGMLVIIGSLSLPVLATATFEGRDSMLAVVSLIVASLTGLGAFYRWDATWRSRAKTAHALEGLIARWELQLAAYELGTLEWKDLLQSTREFVDEVYGTVGAETDQFFASVKFPEVSASSSTPT